MRNLQEIRTKYYSIKPVNRKKLSYKEGFNEEIVDLMLEWEKDLSNKTPWKVFKSRVLNLA